MFLRTLYVNTRIEVFVIAGRIAVQSVTCCRCFFIGCCFASLRSWSLRLWSLSDWVGCRMLLPENILWCRGPLLIHSDYHSAQIVCGVRVFFEGIRRRILCLVHECASYSGFRWWTQFSVRIFTTAIFLVWQIVKMQLSVQCLAHWLVARHLFRANWLLDIRGTCV